MLIEVLDWKFQVNVESTRNRTTKNATDHCTCGYCRNYYEAFSKCYPKLISFLEQFGVNFQGPSELMPFEPTLMLSCYRVKGQILQWGREVLSVDGASITPEQNEDGTFFLWVGELPVPWLQDEDMGEVVSPANLPEFLARMQEVWYQRHGEELIFS